MGNLALRNYDYKQAPFWKHHCDDQDETRAFAEILDSITVKYDTLFETSFPYSSGIYKTPTDKTAHPEWHFHMHFYPPLLRSANEKKFMGGYEMMGEAQRDRKKRGDFTGTFGCTLQEKIKRLTNFRFGRISSFAKPVTLP